MPEARAAPPSPGSPDAKLAKERLDAATRIVAALSLSYQRGLATLDEMVVWNERLFRAQEDVLTGQALVDAARARVTEMRRIEDLARQSYKTGAKTEVDVDKITYQRSTAELDLARVSR
jgi:outer membrane protein TolC